MFPLRSPLIRSKLCPFFILTTWIVAVAVSSPYLFANKIVECPEGTWCVAKWEKVFRESSSYASFVVAILHLFTYIPAILLVFLNSILLIKLKTQAHPGEHSANTRQQRNRRDRNVLQMSIAIVTVFVLCLLPCATTVLIIEYQDRSSPFLCSFCIYDVVTLFMANMYCVINPVICFLFSSIINKKLLKDS